jgi:hypothetical protein
MKSRFAHLCILTAALQIALAQIPSEYDSVDPWWRAGEVVALPQTVDWENPNGILRTLNVSGDIQTRNHPFFTALGANGRACITCHQPANAMSVGTALLQRRWGATQGKDPIFAAVDGSNCPDQPQNQMSSHSLLLNRGLFRIGLPWPPVASDGASITPDFQIAVVNDPTGCNTSPIYGLDSLQPTISVYRRPRVAANLQYLATAGGMALMADGRKNSLQSQAMDAVRIHEEASVTVSADQLAQIVQFETQVFAAQNWDIRGGTLNDPRGPVSLGVDNLAAGTPGTDRVPGSANAFDNWQDVTGLPTMQKAFHLSVVRGADLYFSRQFQVSAGIMATCASCHQPGPPVSADVGTTTLPTAKNSPELPLFRITCDGNAPPHPVLGSVFYTQDPGRALITGKCADAGSILPQQFRGLAARAPYFSNGSAATLGELVDFYDQRFAIALSDEEKQDLVNLLSIF